MVCVVFVCVSGWFVMGLVDGMCKVWDFDV